MLARARRQMRSMVALRKPSSANTSTAASNRRRRVSAERSLWDISIAYLKYAIDQVNDPRSFGPRPLPDPPPFAKLLTGEGTHSRNVGIGSRERRMHPRNVGIRVLSP